ncbi:MAG: dienelactone hydrolase family protein [Vicinamibacterales bacterium]
MSPKPTDKAIKRRDFIAGAASGVVGAMAMGTAVSAQAQQAAAPAPSAAAAPAGRVSYSAIMGETVQMRGHNGDMIDAYVARPTTPGRYPGVVVVHHMPGWDEPTIEITRKFAQRGYTAICPNLHFRQGKATPEANSASIREAGGMPDDRTMGDIDGAVKYLRALSTLNGKVGIIGYCSGGRQVYLAACTVKGIDAAVPCYPGGVGAGNVGLTPAQPVDPLDLSKNLSCPLLGIFGKEDRRPSPEHVAKIDAELKKLGKTYELVSFDGAGHSIFAVDRADYRPLVAQEGWKKIFEFYGKHLA